MFAAPPTELVREYGVKAGFIYNFLSFVTWPPETLPAGAPWRIGVVDDGTRFDLIATALADKSVDKRPLEVVRVVDPSDAKGLHILFVTKQTDRDVASLLEACQEEPVLLLGETAGFARDTGIIGFVTRGTNLRLEINVGRAREVRLTISSRLASLADIVRSKP